MYMAAFPRGMLHIYAYMQVSTYGTYRSGMWKWMWLWQMAACSIPDYLI
jgi:hypothetical protein